MSTPDAPQVLVDKVAERGQRGLLGMEEACFGVREAETIWRLLDRFVERATGERGVDAFHYSVSIGVVVGIRLDSRAVALKVFPPWHRRDFLEAADAVR